MHTDLHTALHTASPAAFQPAGTRVTAVLFAAVMTLATLAGVSQLADHQTAAVQMAHAAQLQSASV